MYILLTDPLDIRNDLGHQKFTHIKGLVIRKPFVSHPVISQPVSHLILFKKNLDSYLIIVFEYNTNRQDNGRTQ